MPDLSVMSPSMQYGFAGFAFLLLGVVVWMIKQLLKVLKDTNTVVGNNTQVMNSVHETAGETRELMIEVKDQLLSRPCLMQSAERAKLAATQCSNSATAAR